MAKSVLEQLKGLESTWKEAKTRQAGQFQELPDGDYPSICTTARVENAKKSQRLQIAWAHKVQSGEHKGRTIFTYQGLGDESNISWAKSAIEAHGQKAPKYMQNLPKILEKCLNQEVVITINTNGQYSNKYINPPGKETNDGEEVDLELEDL